MKNFYLYIACFLGIFATTYSVGADCLKKEKALALLETAEGFLHKARLSYPSCNDVNTTDELECSRKKSLAYIEISKTMISDARRNFPICPKPVKKDEKIMYEKFRHCAELLASGHNESGVYNIWLGENLANAKPLQVYCDMKTDHGGWTVIQRRGKYPVQQNFYLEWESYKNGFGNLTQEFWLGNENIRVLCAEGCEIRFDLQDEEGKKGFAHYNNFKLSDSNYRLNISGFSGNVGDGMSKHASKYFSTKDKGDTNSAYLYKGGWWYADDGNSASLNGMYLPGAKIDVKTVSWKTWRSYDNLASVEIKVRTK